MAPQVGQAEVDSFFRQILGGGHGRLKQPETRMEVYAIKVTLLSKAAGLEAHFSSS